MTDDLSRSLGDPTKTFWVQDELLRLCREALRTWNSYANYWRSRRQFSTTANNHYYDLAALGLVSTPADRGALTNDLQYALVEPFSVTPPFDTFTTSGQFTSTQIDSALQQALKQFQFDAGMTLNVEPVVPLPVAPAYQAQLNENVADVRHVNIRIVAPGDPLDNRRAHLRRLSEAETQWYSAFDLSNARIPDAYNLIFPTSQPTLRIIPESSTTGELEVVSVRSNLLPPTDYQWAVKWLTLSYLLSMDGQSRDHERATYCRKRYEDALLMAQLVPSIAVAYINGITAPIVPVSDMDSYSPGWRNTFLVAGQIPDTIINYGWNLVGVHPTPSTVAPTFSISFDMFVEAPVGTDPIQIAPEHLQAVLDYAKHIAIFKLGGSEFANTTPLMERFVMEAARYNSRLEAESRQLWTMRDRANRDRIQRYGHRSAPDSSESAPSAPSAASATGGQS